MSKTRKPVKFNCSTCVLRKGDLEMSQQRDLLESMTCHGAVKSGVTGAVESGKIQRSVAGAVEVARSVNAKMWNRFQDTLNDEHRPGQGRPCSTTETGNQYILLTARSDGLGIGTQTLQAQLILVIR